MRTAILGVFFLVASIFGLRAQSPVFALNAQGEPLAGNVLSPDDRVMVFFHIEDAMTNRMAFDLEGIDVILLEDNGQESLMATLPVELSAMRAQALVDIPSLMAVGMPASSNLELRLRGFSSPADRAGQPSISTLPGSRLTISIH